MRTSAFFKSIRQLKNRHSVTLKHSFLITVPEILLFLLPLFYFSCERDKPDKPKFDTALLTSAVWGDENICGFPSSPELNTRIFRTGGLYTEYYTIYRTLYNGTWSLGDDEHLIINGDLFEITTLTENLLEIEGRFCKSNFTALRQTKAVTVGITALSASSARLHGFIRTCDLTDISFEYGTSTSYGSVAVPGDTKVAGPANEMVNATLTGLLPSTVYHFRIKITNTKGTFYGLDQTFRTFDEETVTDADNNIYNTITIGSRVWMTENLRTTKYNDGTSIPTVRNGSVWTALGTPGYCWHENDSLAYKDQYGAVYNWYAVNTGKLCPDGWHVPDEQEWNALIQLMGQNAGSKLTEGGYDLDNPLLCAIADIVNSTNESGLSARCSAWRSAEGGFYVTNSVFWSSTEKNLQSARGVNISNASASINDENKKTGLNVRCIKD